MHLRYEGPSLDMLNRRSYAGMSDTPRKIQKMEKYRQRQYRFFVVIMRGRYFVTYHRQFHPIYQLSHFFKDDHAEGRIRHHLVALRRRSRLASGKVRTSSWRRRERVRVGNSVAVGSANNEDQRAPTVICCTSDETGEAMIYS